MENDKNNWRDQDEQRQSRQDENSNEDYLGADKDVSGNDIVEEGREQRRFHQNHGNRRYESHSNHTSAHDQPSTDTGPGTV